jgi:hypothetical protein
MMDFPHEGRSGVAVLIGAPSYLVIPWHVSSGTKPCPPRAERSPWWVLGGGSLRIDWSRLIALIGLLVVGVILISEFVWCLRIHQKQHCIDAVRNLLVAFTDFQLGQDDLRVRQLGRAIHEGGRRTHGGHNY